MVGQHNDGMLVGSVPFPSQAAVYCHMICILRASFASLTSPRLFYHSNQPGTVEVIQG
jgi:hypothetical protein